MADIYKDKNILVIGIGRSGRSAAEFLLGKGAKVTVYDAQSPDDINDFPYHLRKTITFLCGVDSKTIDASDYDLIVVSPGIPPSNSIISTAEKMNIQVISELELGLRALPFVYIIAVTGTNGKTTTCKILEHITGGKLAGNIGTPLTEVLEEIQRGDLVILEVSSFQIPYSPSLSPDIAIMLNISPEHLSWHQGYEEYRFAKKEMFLRQTKDNVAILNSELEDIEDFEEGVISSKIYFSSQKSVSRGIFLEDNNIIYIDSGGTKTVLMDKNEIKFPGTHNLENVMAALAAWKVLGANHIPSLDTFSLPPHRIEKIATFDHIDFIDDSKATNMDSTLKALESINGPIVLLMGGRSKEHADPRILDAAKDKVIKVIAFGESREEIYNFFNGHIPVVRSSTLKKATSLAWSSASAGATVLLSPGGSSYDEFADYNERGLKFKKWVEELGNK